MQRHDFDPIPFIFGLAFTGLGVLFMTGRLELLNHAQWLWPGLLVLLGLAVLVGARGRGGARATRPALQSGSRVDPALEDDLLHSPMRTIDSEELKDTSSLFKLQPQTRKPEETAGGTASRPKETAGSQPEAGRGEPPAGSDTAVLPAVGQEAEPGRAASEEQTEVLPKVDREVDREAGTELLPRPGPKEEPDER